MAFDIYAGPFTRFYRRDWENVVQRQARLAGTEYKMIYAGGDPGPPPPAREVREAVDAWRGAILHALAEHGLKNLSWSEDDGAEYITDRPGWEGYSGLLLWAAYAEKAGEQPPYELPKSWSDDPTYQSVMASEQGMHFVSILQASLWLPGDFDFCFKFPGLVDQEVMIGSCKGLRDQLRELEQRPLTWKTPSFLQGLRGKSSVTTEDAAKSGHACFSAIANEATEKGLPIVLSF